MAILVALVLTASLSSTVECKLSYYFYYYSTAALIRNAKNRLKGHLFTLFSLDIFDMRIEKAAVFFDKIFNLIFLLSFSVIRLNFGIFLVLFNGGVLLLVEWT